MPAELTGLDRIPEPIREPIQRYADLVRELAGENALALTAYGAIAAGTFEHALHTVRNVLVLEAVDLDVLRRLAEHGAKLGKARISAPVIMTPAYIQASLDTFPLEMIEIHQQHVTLFGKDYFDDLTFKEADVRLQSERELKTVMIRMRQGLLAAAGRQKLLGELELDIGETLIRTLRGLLWLEDDKEPKPASRVVTAVEKVIEKPLPGVRAALERTGEHGWDQFRTLYADVETLGKIVDAR